MPNLKILYILTTLFTCFYTPLSSQIIYVKPNGSGNGSSWTQAQGNLRQAIIAAPKGSQIWVAAGIYTPTTCRPCGDADRRLSFEFPDSIAIYGGFKGNETTLNQRNWKENITVLSGNIDNDTTSTYNSFNVIYTKNVSKQLIVNGFTILDGNADDTMSSGERTTSGGGWYNDARLRGSKSSPLVQNCIFKNNRSAAFGSAMVNNASFGGLCETVYNNCSFIDNKSQREGGAIRNDGAFDGSCTPTFTFCHFQNNYSGASGGAIFNDGIEGICNPTFTNCRFLKNTTNTYGGAIYNIGKSGNCSPTISNCLFWGNKALSAAALYCLGSENGNSSPRITNCVFYKNEANTCGSIYANANDSSGKAAPTILNCIIWGNIATTAPYIRSIESYPILDYSIIDAPNAATVFKDNVNGHGTCGSHVLFNQNPLFADPENGDFRIIPPSPAINSGVDSIVNNIGLTVDLDSFPRIVESHVDMGILEYNPALYFPPRLEQSPTSITVCEKDQTVLKAVFSGSPPLYYQWYKNDVAISNATADTLKFASGITLSDSGAYKCIVHNSLNIKDSSQIAIIKTKPLLPLSISIASDRIPDCEGDSITLTASWTNGGTKPKFDWRINDQPLGLSDSLSIYRAAVNSIWFRYTCRITSNEQCAVPRTTISNELQYTQILPRDTGILTLIKNTIGTHCANDTIQFLTTAQHAGDTPQYQWFKNNTLINNILSTLKITNLSNNDTIKAVMTSSKKCLIKNPIESNKIIASISPRTIVNINITATQTDICKADTVTLTATSTGGGTSPQYQWQLNGLNISGANAFFHKTNALKTDDKLRVQLISSAICPSVASVFSNEIMFKVNERLTPTIELVASKSELCPKETVIFSTNATALGTSPQYQWSRNNLIINNIAPSYTTDSLKLGDTIRVIATSSERCLTHPKATSNGVSPKVNLCNGIAEIIENQVIIYPNPSSENWFRLSGLNHLAGEKWVTVFNATGQILLSKKVETGISETIINCEQPLSNGFYWVKINNTELSFYKKWVTQMP
ncbi:MAG: immunoglobulin domain-containing protein [Saprospiraceae bacterium]|nr:immunoglobulin domain-containing protein [Saprospiraceae bacterium]